MYKRGEISKDACRRIIHLCAKGVNWCDGNEYEAVDSLVADNVCGLCLEECDAVSSVYDNDLRYPQNYSVFDDYEDDAAHYFLCAQCKKKVIDEYIRKHSH